MSRYSELLDSIDECSGESGDVFYEYEWASENFYDTDNSNQIVKEIARRAYNYGSMMCAEDHYGEDVYIGDYIAIVGNASKAYKVKGFGLNDSGRKTIIYEKKTGSHSQLIPILNENAAKITIDSREAVIEELIQCFADLPLAQASYDDARKKAEEILDRYDKVKGI